MTRLSVVVKSKVKRWDRIQEPKIKSGPSTGRSLDGTGLVSRDRPSTPSGSRFRNTPWVTVQGRSVLVSPRSLKGRRVERFSEGRGRWGRTVPRGDSGVVLNHRRWRKEDM